MSLHVWLDRHYSSGTARALLVRRCVKTQLSASNLRPSHPD